MSQIVITVPGAPVAQPRAKATTIGGKARMYTPTSRKDKAGNRRSNGVAEFKALVRLTASKEFGNRAPLAGPLRVDCVFVFPRPKGMIWKRKPMPRVPKTTKPDRDNLDKMILDSLTGVIFQDDNQVWTGTPEKWIAAGDEPAHTRVTVTEDDGQQTKAVEALKT